MIFIDIFALVGGCILSLCLIPQIYTIIKSKNSENISYLWQFFYFIGLFPHLIYGIYYDLIPIYVPTAIELILLIVLIFTKYNYNKKSEINI